MEITDLLTLFKLQVLEPHKTFYWDESGKRTKGKKPIIIKGEN